MTSTQAFVAFDRLTAYRCQQRGVPYDREACQKAWDDYCAILAPLRPQTPMGLR